MTDMPLFDLVMELNYTEALKYAHTRALEESAGDMEKYFDLFWVYVECKQKELNDAQFKSIEVSPDMWQSWRKQLETMQYCGDKQ
jgi:hypothetical protein